MWKGHVVGIEVFITSKTERSKYFVTFSQLSPILTQWTLCKSIRLHQVLWSVISNVHCTVSLGHDLCFCIFSFTRQVSEMILKYVVPLVSFLLKLTSFSLLLEQVWFIITLLVDAITNTNSVRKDKLWLVNILKVYTQLHRI